MLTPWTDTDVEGISNYLAAVDPGDVSANGVAAYAAALSFQEIVEGIVAEDGVNGVTRAAVLAKLAAGSPVTAEGILAEGTVLGEANSCWVVNQITGGEWTRVDPAEAGQFTCDDNVTVTVSGDFK